MANFLLLVIVFFIMIARFFFRRFHAGFNLMDIVNACVELKAAGLNFRCRMGSLGLDGRLPAIGFLSRLGIKGDGRPARRR